MGVVSGGSGVKPGGTALFKIAVSSSGATSSGVTVSLSTDPASATSHFTVCGNGDGTKTCKLGSVGASKIELQAALGVPTSATNGQHMRLLVAATASSPKPKNPVQTAGVVTVVVPATSSGGTSGLAGTSAGTSAGTAGLFNTNLSAAGLAGGSLPLVEPTQGGNVGNLLPAVTPSPSTQPAPGDGTAAAAADSNPLDRRLMGTQLLGLAALCAAIGLVIAKFTLRTPRPVPGGAVAGGAAAAGGTAAGTAGSAGSSVTGTSSTGTDSPGKGATGKGSAGEASAGTGSAGSAPATVDGEATDGRATPPTPPAPPTESGPDAAP